MLTATYSLLAIQFEQKNACSALARLRCRLHPIQREKECIDQAMLGSMIGQLQHFDRTLHARKIERFVIPVLCCATDEVDLLLEELDRLSLSARRSLSTLQQYLYWGARCGDHHLFFSTAAQYCETMSQRLVKEDKSLMPLIGVVLTREDWFALGARFLTEDGARYTSRCDVPPLARLATAITDDAIAMN